VKVGRLVKFWQDHLDKWIDQHTVKAQLQPQKLVGNDSTHSAERFVSGQLLEDPWP
jgi:hypothetical protein